MVDYALFEFLHMELVHTLVGQPSLEAAEDVSILDNYLRKDVLTIVLFSATT
jgi:hypothetical protein